jgi:hypothetical protein
MPGKRGHVQDGRRFAVIVQADDLLATHDELRSIDDALLLVLDLP